MRYRVWLLLSLVVAGAFAGGIARADDVPDAATLRAKMAAATGTPPPNFRETTAGSGTFGTTEETGYHLGADSRFVYGWGPIHTERGVAGGDAWVSDPNGLAIADVPDPTDADTEARADTVSRSTAPDAYVLASLAKSGYGVKTYVDPLTFQTLRIEERSASGTRTTTNTSFATFCGRRLPATWTVVDSSTSSTMTYTRQTCTLGVVTADDVAVPPLRTLVTFPPGIAKVTLPTTFQANGHIVVHGSINGVANDFFLDSGASTITISPGVAKRLGLPITNRVDTTIAGRVTIEQTVIPVLKIGSLELRNIAVSVVPGIPGADDMGLLGFDFFATLGISIDYEHQSVSVVDGMNFVAPRDPHTHVLDLRLQDGQAMTTGFFNGARADRLIIDTGAGGSTFLLFNFFSRRHPEVFVQPEMTNRVYYGIGGHVDTEAWRMKAIALGNLTLENFTGYRVVGTQSYAANEDGLIGTEFLRHFNLDFDYLGGKLYMRQNTDGALVGR